MNTTKIHSLGEKGWLILLLVVIALSVCTMAMASGTCGNNLTWTLDSNGILTISGTGEMDMFGYSDAPWNDDSESITSVIIEDGVSSIGDNAFNGCDAITKITIPNSVAAIGKRAFSGCSSLVSIAIPDAVTTIGEWTFYGCKSLTSITLPSALTHIDALAFADCKSLTDITIPASIASIKEDRVFKSCTSLRSINVESGSSAYTSEDGVLFNADKTQLIAYPAGKQSNSYTIPDGVIGISAYAFYWNEHLVSITIPEGVISIGSDTFAGCSKLTSVTIPEGVTSLGNSMFFSCKNLTSVTFPASLVSIGNYMFESCGSLTSIDVSGESTTFSSVDGVFFSADQTQLIAFPPGKQQILYDIPSGVTSIGTYAFGSSWELVNVTFPDSLVSIGDSAFAHCWKLVGITFPDSLVSIGDRAFTNCNELNNIVLPASTISIGDNAFAWCKNLVSVTIPPSVTSIGKSAFSYSSSDLVIHGVAGSAAESYANDGGIAFVADLTTEQSETTDSWTCTQCDTSQNVGKFCSECGAERPAALKCENCGFVPEDDIAPKFCPECGTKFE